MIELKVTGMNCQHCVRAVKGALEAVAGVTRAERVDLDFGRALVEGDVDPQVLVDAVREAGYTATIVQA